MPQVCIDVVAGRRPPAQLRRPAGPVPEVGSVTDGAREDRSAGRGCWAPSDGDL